MSGSLNLEGEQQTYVRHFKDKIETLSRTFKVDVDKCPDCDGTGMYDVNTFRVIRANGKWGLDHSWSGLYCAKCRGVGYINLDKIPAFEKCSVCKGKGYIYDHYQSSCNKCCGVGYLLWIDNIIGVR